MACMWYPIGFTVAANPSSAVVKLDEDGTATLLTGTVETGQGSLTILAQIVAQELGISTDDVNVVSADTDSTPMDTGAIASRTTYVTGNAARLAAEKVKLMLFDVVAPLLNVKPNQLEAKDHRIVVKGFPQRNMHIGDAANHARTVTGEPPIGSASFNPATVALDPETGQGKPFGTYVYATQIAEVEVDDETGEPPDEPRREVDREERRPPQHPLDDADLPEAHHVHPDVDDAVVQKHRRHETPRLAARGERTEVPAERDHLLRRGPAEPRAARELEREHRHVRRDETVGDPRLPAVVRLGRAAGRRTPGLVRREDRPRGLGTRREGGLTQGDDAP